MQVDILIAFLASQLWKFIVEIENIKQIYKLPQLLPHASHLCKQLTFWDGFAEKDTENYNDQITLALYTWGTLYKNDTDRFYYCLYYKF